MRKGQSERLTEQQKEGHGPETIFGKDAKILDKEVYNNSIAVIKQLKSEYPMLTFRYRTTLTKKEINDRLHALDKRFGQTLFVESANIKPDGDLIEVLDDNNKWRLVLVSEAKHQGNDIENIKNGTLVGKNNDQDIMTAGNAIERSHKNIDEVANYMLSENYFPYVLFLDGTHFLTENVTISRPNGEDVTLVYNDGKINRLDRLTAANYGMPINTNLCKNVFVRTADRKTIMTQAASIYTKGNGEHWDDEEMINIMLDLSHTSLEMLSEDLSRQINDERNDK